MTERSPREVRRRLEELEASTTTPGERPEPLSDEDREFLDDFFSPPFDEEHDRVMQELHEAEYSA